MIKLPDEYNSKCKNLDGTLKLVAAKNEMIQIQ